MKSKIEIIPAILPKDFEELEEKVSLIQGLVKTVQVDVCDGKFARNATWPYKRPDESFEKIIQEENGLPFWDKLDYEFDLMVENPDEVADDWVMAGATRITLHVESESIPAAIARIKNRVEIGLALNMETSVSEIKPHENDIQFLQCMGIDRIGFQGQTFDEKVFGKIKEIKLAYPNMPVSVDGGVSLDNAERLIAYGVDRLVIGSAVFYSENISETIEKFKFIGRKH